VGNVVLVNASLKTKNHIYVINMEANAANAAKPGTGDTVGEVRNKKGFRRDKYKNNKMLSIELCRQYISENEQLQKRFNENKKKDDLSDACLQAVSYIRSNTKGDITNKYNKLYSSGICCNENNEKEEAS
jgi:hypothetical protein